MNERGGSAKAGHAVALGLLVGLALPAGAADLAEPAYQAEIRYFPYGDDGVVRRAAPPRVVLACPPGAGVTPTNGPLDPSYVGSSLGLGKPSYYGLTPPPGVDDPYGRRLRACP
ncbi:conserved hypothetical protein [Methylobacterium sp. 4-46]|uniref:hypothetical protein n=1 Tax=unclassified Methylobacterium TaxID=2615210 RepID=UPI000152CD24|nr:MULTISPECIES: hypothetical protein [Methylobacterium]ACA15908.1 conserved hypothetical protein [Methylobacterium sp. 4-46]WFT81625.1 hypothetical protein QA634_07065 [Methylobacterium nodulans]